MHEYYSEKRKVFTFRLRMQMVSLLGAGQSHASWLSLEGQLIFLLDTLILSSKIILMSELKNNQSKPFVSKVLRLLKNTFTLSIFTRITTSFSKYRRSGINTYAACKRWEYYREMGKLGEIGAILKNNEAAIMVWNKLGEKILGEGRLLRLFGIVIWKEKPL